jgi:HSP20 family protein
MSMLPTRTRVTLDPLQELSRVENRIRRLFEEPFGFATVAEPVAWAPPVDVTEADGSLVVTAELPGMKKEDVEVDLTDGVLTIRGEKKEESERKDGGVHVTERSYGAFRRAFTLPGPVDEAQVQAEFKDGVLRVTLPRTQMPEGKKITITG